MIETKFNKKKSNKFGAAELGLNNEFVGPVSVSVIGYLECKSHLKLFSVSVYVEKNP